MKPAVKELLRQLEALAPEATVDDALTILETPNNERLETARRRAALVRRLDRDVYAFLTNDLESPPSLDELLQDAARDFRRIPPNSWEMIGRERRLNAWTQNEVVWRRWNSSIFTYFSERATKSAEVEAVYHGAASSDPGAVTPYFQARYQRADDQTDFAHCHALLEALRSQESYYGVFSAIYQDRVRYLEARLLFLEPLRKTAFFVNRLDAERQLLKMIDRTDEQSPWIFHLHATGGMGKTTFLNHLMARNLILRRIPCARADFDDEELKDVVVYPMRLLSLILRQWTLQMTGDKLASSTDILEKARQQSGWNDVVINEVRLNLQGAKIRQPMVVVLDTLEDVTLSEPEWLAKCIDTLSRIHRYLPHMTVILSGRYNMAEKGQALTAANSIVYELPHFTEGEALDCLHQRLIFASEMQRALIDRASVEQGNQLLQRRLNPFKLALLAEIVTESPEITADKVRQLPSAEIGYLIQRVILKIKSQPLRWMVRYASVARSFTRDFLKQVLLPPLRVALRGGDQDLSAKQSKEIQTYLGSEIPWVQQPELAESILAEELWSGLGTYARDRGWITLSDGKDVLQLHPEVVDPVRLLLREEPVRTTLHQRARDYFLNLWQTRKTREESASAAVEAVYHAAELEGAGAAVLWRKLLEEAESDGMDALVIAAEPTGYLVSPDRIAPRFEEWFCEAHLRCAELFAKKDGAFFSQYSSNWTKFLSHIKAVQKVRPDFVTPLWSVVVAASGRPSDQLQAEELERGLKSITDPADRFWLHQQAARAYSLAADDKSAETHWLRAREFAQQAGLEAWRVDSELAGFYSQLGSYSKAVDSYKRVRANAPPSDRANATVLLCDLALDHRDLSNARKFIKVVPNIVSEFERKRLKYRIALAGADESLQAQRNELLTLRADIDTRGRAKLDSLDGEFFAFVFDYREAEESMGRATKGYESLDDDGQALTCRIRELAFAAMEMESDRAEVIQEKLRQSKVFKSEEQRLYHELSWAYREIAQGKREEAKRRMAKLLSTPLRLRYRLVGIVFAMTFDLSVEPIPLRALGEMFFNLAPDESGIEALNFLQYREQPSEQLKQAFPVIQDWLDRCGGSLEPLWQYRPFMSDIARLASAKRPGFVRLLESAADKLDLFAFALEDGRHLSRLAYHFRLIEAAERAGTRPPASYRKLWSMVSAEHASTPLAGLIQSKAAQEMATLGKPKADEARNLAQQAVAVWDKQPECRRKREVHQVLADLIGPTRVQVNIRGGAGISSGANVILGTNPPKQNLPSWHIRGSGKLNDAAIREDTHGIISQFFKWDQALEQLEQALSHIPDIPGRIITSVSEAALPWEFTSRGGFYCRGIEGQFKNAPTYFPPNRQVLLVQPMDEAEDDLSFAISLESVSGFSIEFLYKKPLGRVGVLSMREPAPDELRETISRLQPGVIHLVGQLLEESTGVTMDFEGSGRRFQERIKKGVSQKRLQSRLDPERLIRYLAGQRPFVILDVTLPDNITDQLRMLLLRNRFAADLFRSGQVAGVLATGLQAPYDRIVIAEKIVSAVVRGDSPGKLVRELRPPGVPKELEDAISQYSAALFSNDPTEPMLLKEV